MCVGGAAVAHHFGVDRGAARGCRGEVFNNEGTRPLAKNEAGAILVVGAACRCWALAGARRTKAAHVHEPDMGNLDEGVLCGAGDDGGDIATLDRLGRFA